jgi:hypothetical protein
MFFQIRTGLLEQVTRIVRTDGKRGGEILDLERDRLRKNIGSV